MKKILIIDDDEISLHFLSNILKGGEFEVISESSSEMALEKIKEDNFDLVVTDICMPRVNGFQILEEAKKRKENISVIGISSSFTRTREFLSKGFYAFFLKPFDKEKFLTIIKKAAT